MSTSQGSIETTAVILCGGRGKRLGAIGETRPKALLEVRGRPILWYIFLALHRAGFRRFILPIGFLGGQITAYVRSDLELPDSQIEMIDTGLDSEIGRRLTLVRDRIGSDSVLLVNGDTLFDFDVAALARDHRESGAELTLTSCDIVSQYGLILAEDGRALGFARESAVREFVVVRSGGAKRAFINSGIACLRSSALDRPGVASSANFEHFLYPQLIAAGTGRHYHISGFWHAIDSQKDLEIANADNSADPRAVGVAALHAALEEYARSLVTGGATLFAVSS
jgi:glucose-1-phosphate cytidylyltransferase